MGTLINSLLDLARLEEGRMPLDLEALPVSGVVHKAIYETSAFAQSKNIEIQDVVLADPAFVKGDATVLHRILVNLITNAIKVSPESTSIQVRAEHRNSDEIVFVVLDHGSGVPQEYASRVFDKFVQIQLRKSGVATGTGLGLAFCRAATVAQNGRIWIENVANNGASVFVALPAAVTP